METPLLTRQPITTADGETNDVCVPKRIAQNSRVTMLTNETWFLLSIYFKSRQHLTPVQLDGRLNMWPFHLHWLEISSLAAEEQFWFSTHLLLFPLLRCRERTAHWVAQDRSQNGQITQLLRECAGLGSEYGFLDSLGDSIRDLPSLGESPDCKKPNGGPYQINK